jgi:predicted MFS family arabinose efflux permease
VTTIGGDRRFLISGALLLAVAMGVGRFAYTPLLPVMEHDAGLTVGGAGTLASSNLLGYLIGAGLAMAPFTHRRRLLIVRWAIVAVVVTTALMAADSTFWQLLRFVTGIASAFVLVFVSSIALERAAHHHRPSWPPLVFSGIGVGIAFSGIAVPVFVRMAGSRGAWIGIACVSAVAIALTLRHFVDDERPTAPAPSPIGQHLPKHRTAFAWLSAVYTAEAFAYIIPATFLAAIVSRISSIARFADLEWVLVGLAAALATFPWIHAGARLGKARSLALALGIQAVGIVAPILSGGVVPIVIAALTLGGTFMAITLFATGLAREMFPLQTSAAISRLTVLYALGQMVGPSIATQLALRTGSYEVALLMAGTIAGIAAVTTLITVREPRFEGNVSQPPALI